MAPSQPGLPGPGQRILKTPDCENHIWNCLSFLGHQMPLIYRLFAKQVTGVRVDLEDFSALRFQSIKFFGVLFVCLFFEVKGLLEMIQARGSNIQEA